jgi:hypothetical protein
MFKKIFFALALSALALQSVTAQHWPPSADKEYHNSIVKIIGDGYGGSGTVIKRTTDVSPVEGYYIGWILTASHVIYSQNTIFTIYFNNGAITDKATVVDKGDYDTDAYCDFGLIRALIPNSVKPMEICEEDVPIGSRVELAGFGAGDFRHWVADYAGDKSDGDGHIVLTWAIQGDSGGPIIYKGKVIGVICFGTGIEKYGDTPRMIVAPVYGTCVSRIRKLD